MNESHSLVIVAVPSVDDAVWKISSEKVPHMTLLFLGDTASQEEIARIQDYLQHCINIGAITRFGANVDRRGVLGADEADVVFFEKKYALKKVEDFRGTLLQQPDIKKLYASVDQFDGWTPHTTLGYPGAPAHADTREYPGLHYINFDKLALWTGDFTGLEFELPTDDSMELAMSTSVDSVLEHFGVKGMKWGVRKDRSSGGDSSITTRHKPGSKVTATGGHGRPASEDAKRAVALGQKAKASTSHALTNDELRELLTRLDMEGKYAKLNPPKKTAKRWVAEQVAHLATQELQRVMRGDLSRIEQIEAVLQGKELGAKAKPGKHRNKK